MTDYRRLISYIYEYEGKEKGKNVGFVKLEARNGQCRLNLSVKKIYAGGNAVGVYLLGKNGQKTFLGNIFVRGGNGEFRASVDAKNVEGTGNELDTYYGLTIHDVKNSWRSYTTIWEDAFVGPVAQEILPCSGNENQVRTISNAMKEIEEEIAREEERKDRSMPEAHAAEVGGEDDSEAGREFEEAGCESGEVSREPEEAGCEVEETAMKTDGHTKKEPSGTVRMPEPEENTKGTEDTSEGTEDTSEGIEKAAASSPELEDPEVLRYLQETESASTDPEELWQELRKSYPKIQPFDYEGGCEVLTIRPQDIGRLPRENWVYGNNSFLLHGYYNFRYLILARLENKNGRPRYLIGIPGHYYSNEKYMATMFGFANFVLSKKQPPNDGRFGYWYTDIRMR